MTFMYLCVVGGPSLFDGSFGRAVGRLGGGGICPLLRLHRCTAFRPGATPGAVRRSADWGGGEVALPLPVIRPTARFIQRGLSMALSFAQVHAWLLHDLPPTCRSGRTVAFRAARIAVTSRPWKRPSPTSCAAMRPGAQLRHEGRPADTVVAPAGPVDLTEVDLRGLPPARPRRTPQMTPAPFRSRARTALSPAPGEAADLVTGCT